MASRRQNRSAIPNTATDQPTNAQPSNPDDGEFFDLNVSGGSDDEDAGQPARQPRGPRHATVTAVDQVINDPTPVQDLKKGAADVHYFFERQDDKHVCKVCK
jgi:hypothetical protein